MPGSRTLSALSAVLSLVPACLLAQEPTARWSLDVELGLNGASGNSSFSILRTGFRARHVRTDIAELETSVLVRHGKSDGKVIADDAKATLKLDLWSSARWSPFTFADWSRDDIRRLDTRFSGGAGGKWTFWSGDSGKASFSVAALYDYQNFKVEPGSADPASESLARWSFRTQVEKKLSSSAKFEHLAVYQPVWDEAGDYAMDVTHTVSTQILGNLTLAVEHQYLRDATPPPDVEPADQRFSVLLKMSF